jgi:methionyl-tRNA formyltransferase
MKKSKQWSLDNSRPDLVVFTGDNFFSYILCAAICRSQNVTDIIVSRGTTHSYSKILSIFRKTSIQYFLYRVSIQLLSKLTLITDLATLHNIKLSTVRKKSDFDSFKAMNHYMGVTCNFDLIIPDSYIQSRRGGVLNVHASDLPSDRGISPVVWAFCRGDKEIYISYYLMDGGIDTGEIVRKDVVTIDQSWSLFRTYCEVILYAAKRLDSLLGDFIYNSRLISNESSHEQQNESYNSWPSTALHSIMKKNRKKYFKLSDIRYAYNLLRGFRGAGKLSKS